MAAAVCASVGKLPSALHIALASTVVESKPEGLTIRGMQAACYALQGYPLILGVEYIELLRQHIAKGRREDALSSVHRHLDRSSFWHSEYKRVSDLLQSSEAERIDLKLEIDRLKAKAETSKAANPTKKRKKADEDVVPVPKSPKRGKAEAAQRNAVPRSNVDADFEFSHLGEAGKHSCHTDAISRLSN